MVGLCAKGFRFEEMCHKKMNFVASTSILNKTHN